MEKKELSAFKTHTYMQLSPRNVWATYHNFEQWGFGKPQKVIITDLCHNVISQDKVINITHEPNTTEIKFREEIAGYAVIIGYKYATETST